VVAVIDVLELFEYEAVAGVNVMLVAAELVNA
jgi:hypothetical protein